MGQIFASQQSPALHGLDEADLFFEMTRNNVLHQLIRIAALLGGGVYQLGRDSFWTPAHLPIEFGAVLAALCCGALILGATFGLRRAITDNSVHCLAVVTSGEGVTKYESTE